MTGTRDPSRWVIAAILLRDYARGNWLLAACDRLTTEIAAAAAAPGPEATYGP